jgi:hypothetical protein
MEYEEMADTIKEGQKAIEKADKDPAATVTADPSGEVSNTSGARGTLQHEPKPEDYPASAKVAPPAEQLNPALSQAVGTASVPAQAERDPASKATAKGGELAEKVVDDSMDKAQQIADLQREIDDVRRS